MKLAAMVAIVAALVVLAGCGGSSTSSTTNSSTDAGSTTPSKSLLAGASPEVVLGVNLIVDREHQSKLAETGMEAVHNMIAKRDQPRTIAAMLDASKGHLRRAEADQAQLEKLDPAKHNRAELIYRSEH